MMGKGRVKSEPKPLDMAAIMAIRKEFVLDDDDFCMDPESEADEAAMRVIAAIDKARSNTK